MTFLVDLPVWAAIPVCLLLLSGSAITLAGAIGIVRFQSFYERLHAPTLCTSGGVLLIATSSMIAFGVLQNRWIVHEVLIVIFMIVTTPVTLMLLGQSALYRDRAEKNPEVPRKTETAKTDPKIDIGV
ncbi:cation:proton antiporter [Rhizobium sp. Leaf384]|jgi:multicomponent K+:H+ antiporter subunit G|uniref:monovalent cation/H(+) antiporter subunit G n=1 Tax=unclassified Rhizobium TaxID=2613769 RepID=UPI000714AF03|nr:MULTISPECIES: monovalent cation/H(+) antiporter subunit G [unclassified Rhizobium]KQR75984.1 cation:proton antiporter [Rhizobium sp. Leaf341]KQS76595.1 cation:proton antiporter [Rhizobium sp. Leaf383]KQS77864.1 cation:proton antiporter [Rhizobium sp. Leaf384]